MATWVANGTPAATTATLPAGTATGDWVVCFAYRDANATPPTLPAGWTQLHARATAPSILVAYREKDAGWSAMPTFTNAGRVTATTIRPASGKTLALGVNASQGATSTSFTWAVQTLQVTDGTSIILRGGVGTRPDVAPPTPTNHTLIDSNGTRPGFCTFRKTTSTDMAAATSAVSRSDIWSTAQLEIKDIVAVAVTQASYGFYADGTESGSTLLAQDTAPTIDVTQGNVPLQLRVRLQSTSAAVVPTSTWRTQVEKNASGSWANVTNASLDATSAPSVALTETVTTNRLGAGTGSFVAGTVCESASGSTTHLWTANNYTEILFSIQVRQADLNNGDTLRFRVVRNDLTTTMTYSSTPTINVTKTLPAVTQAAYQFFDDAGTESGAAALAAQDTPVVGDLSNGVGYGALRVRLQSTNAAPLPSTDDWSLRWEKNASGTWNSAAGAIVDSYTTTPNTSSVILSQGGRIYGQSFMGNGQKPTMVGFLLKCVGVPTGQTVNAVLYSHSGSYGNTGKPTGFTPLATSTTTKNVTDISTAGYEWHYFNFDASAPVLANGTPYVVGIQTGGTSGDGSRHLLVGIVTSSPSHGGITQYMDGGTWAVVAATDTPFEVYAASGVIAYDNPNLTGLAATTERLTGGTGTFSPGKVTEAALAANIGWSGNGYTEALYSLKIEAATFVDGDTLRFRVYRNGATTSMTYAVTPTITLFRPPPNDGTAAAAWSAGVTASGITPVNPAVTQVAYQFFDQGTESGSAPLGAQNTPITGNLTTGDGIGSLRVLLQSTNAALALGNWQLQYEKNTSGTWVSVVPAEILATTYPITEKNSQSILTTTTTHVAQSFLGTGGKLSKIVVALAKAGTPPGSAFCAIYAHTGTFGSTGVPTGAPLAVSSTSYLGTALNGLPTVVKDFVFDGSLTLTNGTPYFIAIYSDSYSNTANSIQVGNDTLSPTHAGNAATNNGTTWSADAARDFVFEVYTSAPSSIVGYNDPALTDGAATTNRLTGGTGTFVAGKVSEIGLVSTAGITGNNFTELLYPVQIKKSDFVQDDTIRFRVLFAGNPLDAYSQTPLINVVKANQGTAVVSHDWSTAAVGEAPVVEEGPIPSTGLVGWYDADDPTSFTYSSGAVVSQWADKSGQGRHFGQSNVALQPTRSGTQNGRATLVFDADDYMDSIAPFTVAQPITMFMALAATRTDPHAWLGSIGGDYQIYVGNSQMLYLFNGLGATGVPITFNNTGPHQWCFVSNGASSSARKDGTLQMSGQDTGSAGTTTGWRTAERNLFTNYTLNCPVFEIIVYDRVLTGPEIAQVESYLDTKWLSGAPPPSTGSLTSTDGVDTLTAAVDATPPTHTATLAQTDGRDTLTSVPTFGPTSSLTQTDGVDTLTATVSTTAPTFTATLVQTDGRDTLTSVPTFGPTSALAVTDGVDTVVAAVSTTAPTFTATLTQTDGRDTLTSAIAAGDLFTGSVTVTDGLDTLVASVSTTAPTFTALVSKTDGVDTMVATAVAHGVFTATISVTDGIDTVVATVNTTAPTFTSTLALTDGIDTAVAAAIAGPPTHTGSLVKTDGLDTVVAIGAATPPVHTATLAITDSVDTVLATVNTVAPIFTSTLAKTDGIDTVVTAVSALPPANPSTLAITDGIDTITTLVTAGAVGAAVMTAADGLDTVVAVGNIVAPTFTGTTAQTDGRDTAVSVGNTTAPTYTATLTLTDGRDTQVAAAGATPPTHTGTGSVADNRDTVVTAVNTVAPTFTSTAVRTDGVDTVLTAVSAVPPPNPSTLALTDGLDTVLAFVSAGAVGAAVMAVADGLDTVVSAATIVPPLHTAALAQTDGRDTLGAGASTAPPQYTATASVADRPDTMVASASTVAPTFLSTLALSDGRDIATTAVSAIPPPNPSTLVATDGRDTVAAAVATAAPGNSSGSVTATDGVDTMVAVGTRTVPLNSSTAAQTDGRDTLTATVVFGAAPMNFGQAAASHTWVSTVVGKRPAGGQSSLGYVFTQVAVGTSDLGIGTVMWNGQMVLEMQYGDKAVKDWLLLTT